MGLKKVSTVLVSPAANSIIAILLLSAFFIIDQRIIHTFTIADMAAAGNLRPRPMDYFWKLNFHQALLDKNKLRNFADYYEHLLKIDPSLGEAYGVLGYCYYYLNDEPKAVHALKTAIQNYPDFFWNYYNLAAIYINESRYQDAAGLLQKAVSLDPMASLKKMFSSQMVYLPLLEPDEKMVLEDTAGHLKKVLQSSFVLIRLLDQAESNQAMQEDLSKVKMELFAF